MMMEKIAPDLVQEGIRQAVRHEAIQNIRRFMSIVELACISMPILLALILWRLW
jgi:hypothetical protein